MTEMDPLLAHALATAEFDRRMAAITDGQWSSPTPCTEWDVRALVNHLVGEQLWVPPLLAGQTIAEVGGRFDGDQLGGDAHKAWDEASRAARDAVEEPGATTRTVHLSYGDTPAGAYISDLAMDLAIHAWDLARAIGADETLDPELVAAIDAQWRPRAGGLAGSGGFAPAVDAPSDAPAQVRLLALFGRDGR